MVIVKGRGKSYEITGVPFFIVGVSATVGSILNNSLYLVKDRDFVNNIISSYTFQNEDLKQAFVFVYNDQTNYTILTQGTNFANKQNNVNTNFNQVQSKKQNQAM